MISFTPRSASIFRSECSSRERDEQLCQGYLPFISSEGSQSFCSLLSCLLPLTHEILSSFSSLSSTIDSIAAKLSDNKDFTETAFNVHLLAAEVGNL